MIFLAIFVKQTPNTTLGHVLDFGEAVEIGEIGVVGHVDLRSPENVGLEEGKFTGR